MPTLLQPEAAPKPSIRWRRVVLIVVILVLVGGGLFVRQLASGPALPAGATRLQLATEGLPFSPFCPAAGLVPSVVETDGTSVVLRAIGSRQPLAVTWPSGYAAWRLQGEAEIVDPWGHVVVREGQQLPVVSGSARDGVFRICSVDAQ